MPHPFPANIPQELVTELTTALQNINVSKTLENDVGNTRSLGWSRPTPMTLTYALSPKDTINYLSPHEIKSAFKRSFARWSEVIPVSFTEVENYEEADIRIGFYHGDHGDGIPFNGPLDKNNAHAIYPRDGRIHLNAEKIWAVDFEKEKSAPAVDLESVATHEIGHVLGLVHSKNEGDVMYEYISDRTRVVELTINDVERAQELYGANPNFDSSSLRAKASSGWRFRATRMCFRGVMKQSFLHRFGLIFLVRFGYGLGFFWLKNFDRIRNALIL